MITITDDNERREHGVTDLMPGRFAPTEPTEFSHCEQRNGYRIL